MSISICPELRAHADRAIDLIQSGRPVIRMTGPAGCGKTHAVKYILDNFDGEVVVAAFMGQAARMLQQRGIPASTLHHLLFYPAGKREAEIAAVASEIRAREKRGADTRDLHERLKHLTQPGFIIAEDSALATADLCIVDEATMVNDLLGETLEEFGKPLLLVGDPYQLPPIDGLPFFDLSEAEINLTTVYRQAEGSGILDLATAIRKGETRGKRSKGEVNRRKRAAMSGSDALAWLLWADRVICATNKARRSVNRSIKKHLGLGRYPNGAKGEELICLRNDSKSGLFNGMPIRLSDVVDAGHPLYFSARVHRHEGDDDWTDAGTRLIYKGHFDATDDRLRHERAQEQRRLDDREIDKLKLIECDWAFCTTAHKAQGSEFDKVTVITEGWPNDSQLRTRWLYTAFTRARQQLRIIERWDVRA